MREEGKMGNRGGGRRKERRREEEREGEVKGGRERGCRCETLRERGKRE